MCVLGLHTYVPAAAAAVFFPVLLYYFNSTFQ
jgi:hypothetical protein